MTTSDRTMTDGSYRRGAQLRSVLGNGSTVNTFAIGYQPTFNAAGDTMYFASGRNPALGVAIYRSYSIGNNWSSPELAIIGLVGEPAITAAEQLLYLVHGLSDSTGNFVIDVWVNLLPQLRSKPNRHLPGRAGPGRAGSVNYRDRRLLQLVQTDVCCHVC